MKVFRFPLIILVLALLPSAGCSSCGDDDDDSDDDADDAASDDASDDAADDADDDSSGCGTADMLVGTWTAGNITMEIAEDLTYHTFGTSDMNYDVTGVIVADGCTASFTDNGGIGACPEAQTGQYSFVVTETALTTTLIEDPCAGRVVGLDGTEFDRES